MKQIYGIIGYPVKHSLSPAMQNAAFAALGIDAEYRLFEVEPGGLERFLSELPSKGISGLNVTIPHKICAKEHVEKNGVLDENARKLGAINTIKVSDGKLYGYNTDGPGFYRSLVEELKFEPEGKYVLILGAGGAATAIAMYLGNGPRKIFVYDIDEKKVHELKAHYKNFYDEKKLETVGDKQLAMAMSGSDLVINATPIGMKEGDQLPVGKDLLHPGLYIYDLVYNRQTSLVREAAKRKLHAVTGIGMLLYQGAIAFELWTGRKAPVDIMKKALREALRGGG